MFGLTLLTKETILNWQYLNESRNSVLNEYIQFVFGSQETSLFRQENLL